MLPVVSHTKFSIFQPLNFNSIENIWTSFTIYNIYTPSTFHHHPISSSPITIIIIILVVVVVTHISFGRSTFIDFWCEIFIFPAFLLYSFNTQNIYIYIHTRKYIRGVYFILYFFSISPRFILPILAHDSSSFRLPPVYFMCIRF